MDDYNSLSIDRHSVKKSLKKAEKKQEKIDVSKELSRYEISQLPLSE